MTDFVIDGGKKVFVWNLLHIPDNRGVVEWEHSHRQQVRRYELASGKLLHSREGRSAIKSPQ